MPESLNRSLELPPPVRPGDRIGVAALSGPVDPSRLAAGLAELTALGYRPVPARNLDARHELFAGDDDFRLDAFHELAFDPEIRAICFARGGYGLTRVLPRIDWAGLALHPRAYVGYSDLTPFLAEVVSRLGWVAYHGPMIAAELARGLRDDERDSFMRALAGEASREIALERVLCGEELESPEGRLAGGCLSLLAAVVGTPEATSFDGQILFVEDIHEPLYRLDRMLTQLDRSGSLTGIRAMVVGTSMSSVLDAAAVARLAAAAGGRTIALGAASGHCTPNLTLPLGCPARIDPDRASLVIDPPEQ